MGDLTESPTPQQQPNLTPPSRQVPFREDCWTEEATTTLVEAWGRRFLELNRGNLRQKDWQEVADTVNAHHGHTKKTRRTDVQCKNRIDTLKKKYKTEKAKISESNETLTSSWPFFSRLDFLIGSSYNKNQVKQTPSLAMPLMIMPPPQPVPVSSSAQIHSTMPFSLPSPPMAVPLPYRKPMMPAMMPTMSSAVYNSPMVMPQKRPSPSPGPEESLFRRNYSAVAAAAAAMNYDDEASDDDDEDNAIDDDRVNLSDNDEEDEGVDGEEIGLKRLAKAIESFAETYEKVESMKQRQMIELEKQRMQFAKDLEVQRMQLFMDTQVQLEKMKRVKRSGSSDGDCYLSMLQIHMASDVGASPGNHLWPF